ncbi:MAG: 50S ribosomal protein L9 [Oscillospiraceae bacterium]|jgi:large subunit ribosomal protein L9|nr:50S ribosomal protein L9 [Oscillospiraceae bacterium]
MKVILKANVNGRKAGEPIDVPDGYGSYLLKKELAVMADVKHMNDFKGKQESASFKEAEQRKAAQERANAVQGKRINIHKKGGNNGKLFGTVTNSDIATAVKKELNVDIDKKKLIPEEEIKKFGDFKITAKLAHGIEATFMVCVSEARD